MDEKHAPMPPPIRRGFSPLRLLLLLCWLAFAGWYYLPRGPVLALSSPSSPSSHEQAATANELVPLEAHIMSKCPDAKDCLRDLVLPAMQKVHGKVNFTLSFIGTYVSPTCPFSGPANPGQPDGPK